MQYDGPPLKVRCSKSIKRHGMTIRECRNVLGMAELIDGHVSLGGHMVDVGERRIPVGRKMGDPATASRPSVHRQISASPLEGDRHRLRCSCGAEYIVKQSALDAAYIQAVEQKRSELHLGRDLA